MEKFKPQFDHEQVAFEQEDFTVDKGIYQLVKAIRACGLETQYSCEGYPQRLHSAKAGSDLTPHLTQLLFKDLNDAFIFVKISTDFLGSMWNDIKGSLFHISMMKAYGEEYVDAKGFKHVKFSKTGARGSVHFDPRELERMTILWTELAKMKQVQEPNGSSNL